ncbi:hypothetical protein FANTH_5318 [Fusarium anthophilum]|uniref:Uncharacterized protein n=1 Tax=Fusarium anthophilum TaxID=48485 RepID=A0A8H4ZNB2_9HYPO|nr:hypothetical protein FANTH_5318 [Fusarium anthophilum]
MDPPVTGTRLVPGKVSFLDLAPELQSMILEFLILSICPLTVPCDAEKKYGPITSAGEQSLLNLKLSCRMIYNAIKAKRLIEAFTIVQPQPPRREWHPEHGAIIFPPSRKAFTIDPYRDILRVWDMKLPRFRCSSDIFPVKRILSWIPGFCFDDRFRQTGDPPTNDIAPGQHIGEVWNNGATSHPPGPNEYRCPNSGAMVSFEPPARPLVGLYGYDKTETNRGGFWAGFLYYQLKKEVWFSPLSALEVRDATTVPVVDKPEHQDLPPAQPHHRWVKVKSDQPGDPRYTGQIELMWSIVVDRVTRQTQGETPYELRFARF